MNRFVVFAASAVLIAAGFVRAMPLQQERATFAAATVKPNNKEGGGNYGFIGCHGIDTKINPAAPPTPLGRCMAERAPLNALLRWAYFPGPTPGQNEQLITGGPAWIQSDTWNIEGVSESPETTTDVQLRTMLRTLLEDRFKLQVRHETKQVQGYSLVVAKSGPKLHPTTGDGEPRMDVAEDLTITARNVPIQRLIGLLTARAGGPVTDKTGLTGSYNFTLSRTTNDPGADSPGQSIFTAVQEQLGLRLEPEKQSIETIVVEHAEKPSEAGRKR